MYEFSTDHDDAFSRNYTSNLEFLSFPALVMCSTHSLMILGSSRELQPLGRHTIMRQKTDFLQCTVLPAVFGYCVLSTVKVG